MLLQKITFIVPDHHIFTNNLQLNTGINFRAGLAVVHKVDF